MSCGSHGNEQLLLEMNSRAVSPPRTYAPPRTFVFRLIHSFSLQLFHTFFFLFFLVSLRLLVIYFLWVCGFLCLFVCMNGCLIVCLFVCLFVRLLVLLFIVVVVVVVVFFVVVIVVCFCFCSCLCCGLLLLFTGGCWLLLLLLIVVVYSRWLMVCLHLSTYFSLSVRVCVCACVHMMRNNFRSRYMLFFVVAFCPVRNTTPAPKQRRIQVC